MKKILYAALIVFALGFISRGAASADEALMESMAPGTWTTNPRYITFGEYNGHALKWRVLEVYGDKTAFLVLDDVLREPASDGGVAVRMLAINGFRNSFPGSEVFTFLNDIFLSSLEAYESGILYTTYGPDNSWGYKWDDGDGPENASSKIFLLSVNEATNPKYFLDGENYNTSDFYYLPNADRAVDENYWLRSPGYRHNYGTFVRARGELISGLGDAGGLISAYGDFVFTPFTVRPALKIDLSSPVFTSALVSYPPEKESESE